MDQSPQQSCFILGLPLLCGLADTRVRSCSGNCCCKLERSTASYCSRASEARSRARLTEVTDSACRQTAEGWHMRDDGHLPSSRRDISRQLTQWLLPAKRCVVREGQERPE